MKGIVVLGVIAVLLGMFGAGFFQSVQAYAMPDEPEHKPGNLTDILNATLQIEISLPLDDSGLKVLQAQGLGSLVKEGEETLLVTHNHWGEALQERSVVTFYDTRGQRVTTISGSEFLSQIRYLDSGTLVLNSPLEQAGQPQAFMEGDHRQVQPGDVVMVAQRVGTMSNKVTLIKAKVESVVDIRGVPVIQLKGPEGRPIQAGDSGGGVWHHGILVGNLWFTAVAQIVSSTQSALEKPDQIKFEPTGESYAAMYPTQQPAAYLEPSVRMNRGEQSEIP